MGKKSINPEMLAALFNFDNFKLSPEEAERFASACIDHALSQALMPGWLPIGGKLSDEDWKRIERNCQSFNFYREHFQTNPEVRSKFLSMTKTDQKKYLKDIPNQLPIRASV